MAKGKTNWKYAKQAFDNIGKLNVPGSLGILVRVDHDGIDLSSFHTLLERPQDGKPMSHDEAGAQLQTCAVILTVLREVMTRIEEATPMSMESIHDSINELAKEHARMAKSYAAGPAPIAAAGKLMLEAGGL